MVRTWSFEQLLEVVWGALGGLSTSLVVGGGHERALIPLLVLFLAGMAGGAFIGVLVPLCLALEAIEDRTDRHLARYLASGIVKELLGGSWAHTS